MARPTKKTDNGSAASLGLENDESASGAEVSGSGSEEGSGEEDGGDGDGSEEGSGEGIPTAVVEEPKAKGRGKKAVQSESVEALLRGTKRTEVKVRFKSVSPLLMANMPKEQILNALIRRVRAPIQTDLPETVMAAKFLYTDPRDGKTIGIPSKCLFACIRDAGTLIKLDSKRSISTAAGTTLLPLFFRIKESFLPFEPALEWKGEENEEPKGWAVDIERGQMDNGTTVGIIRPRFDDWSFRATLYVDFNVVAEATVVKLIQTAGLAKGLCANRPACGGQNGQFQIDPDGGWEKVS